jgi:hypothetical protein
MFRVAEAAVFRYRDLISPVCFCRLTFELFCRTLHARKEDTVSIARSNESPQLLDNFLGCW